MALADNVKLFPGVTGEDFQPSLLLEAAARAELQSVFIVGWDKDGSLFLSSSVSNYPECLWLLEHAKRQIMEDGTEEA